MCDLAQGFKKLFWSIGVREGQYKWLASVHSLTADEELEGDRLKNWGEWMKGDLNLFAMAGV
jgi:hypothetical protein